jgi:hypothetical protein
MSELDIRDLLRETPVEREMREERERAGVRAPWGLNGSETLSAQPRKEVGQKRFFSGREIASLAPPSPPWRAKPWVADGALTEVEGKIKAAGKTSWVMALARAVLDGAPFMGQPTAKAPVVYLTEQPLTSLREALRRADLLEREDVLILSRLDVLGLPWREVVALAAEKCEEVGAKLLIIDTLSPFAGLEGDAENSAGDAQAAVAPLQTLAQALKLAVVIVRHSRKGGGEVGESGRGSSAFGGAVDLLISLRRRDGNAPKTQRVIHTLGRFDETPEDLVIDLTDAGYVALGSEDEAGREGIRAALHAALGGAALTDTELVEALEAELGDGRVSRSNLQRVRDEELKKGALCRVGAGKRGDPYRYQLNPPQFVSAQPSLLDGQKETEGAG